MHGIPTLRYFLGETQICVNILDIHENKLYIFPIPTYAQLFFSCEGIANYEERCPLHELFSLEIVKKFCMTRFK